MNAINKTIKLSVILALGLSLSGCASSLWKDTTSFLGFGDDQKDEQLVQTSKITVVKSNTIDDNRLLKEKDRVAYHSGNLDFNGVTNKYDIEVKLAEYEKECYEDREPHLCNAIGKYYLEQDKFDKAKHFYSLGCTKYHKYGCGVADFIDAGGK